MKAFGHHRWLATFTIALMLGQLVILPAPEAVLAQSTPTASTSTIWQMLPSDTTALVELRTDTSSASWQQATDLLQASGLDRLFTGLIDIATANDPLARSILDPETSPFADGTLVAATWGDAASPFAHGALLVAVPDPDHAAQTLMNLVFGDDPGDRLTAKTADLTQTTVTGSDAAILTANGIVILADQESATTLVALLSGSGSTLADFPAFSRTRAALDPDQLATAWFNGPASGPQLALQLVDQFGLSFGQIGLLGMLTGQFAGKFTAVGFRAVSTGIQIRLAQLPAPIVGGPLPGPGSTSDGASIISDQADMLITGTDIGTNPMFRAQIGGLLFGLADVGMDSGSTGTISDAGFAALQQEYGVDLAGDLLDQLTGDFVLAVDPSISASDLTLTAALVGQSGVADSSRVVAFLQQVADLVSGTDIGTAQLTTDGSTTTLRLDMGNTPGAITITVSPDRFRIEAAFDGPDLFDPPARSSLFNDPTYQAALASLPDASGNLIYINTSVDSSIPDLLALFMGDSDIANTMPISFLNGVTSVIASSRAVDGLAITDIMAGMANLPAESDLAFVDSAPPFAAGDVSTFSLPEVERIYGFSPDGQTALVSMDENTCLVETTTGAVIENTCTDQMRSVDADHLAWSPDGAQVAVTEDAARLLQDSDIWVFDRGLRRVRNLTEDSVNGNILSATPAPGEDSINVDLTPAWSPDATRIAFGRSSLIPGGGTQLMVVDLLNNDARSVGSISTVPFASWGGIAWQQPDQIVVGIDVADRTDPQNGIWTFDIATGQGEQIYTPATPADIAWLTQSAAGTSLVIAKPAVLGGFGDTDICALQLLDSATGQLTPLAVGPDAICATSAGIRLTGSDLVLTAIDSSGTILLALQNVATGNQTLLDTTPITAAAGTGTWSLGMRGRNLPIIPWLAGNSLLFATSATTWITLQLDAVP